MIYKRAIAKLRAQDWFAIGIELGIVILGVFIGTWVANLNQQASERRQAERMVAEVRPGLWKFDQILGATEEYFATAGRYAETAFAGWAEDRTVSDEQFVIAAYQASQITQVPMNGASWTQIYGGSELSKLPDSELRSDLAEVMALDFGQLNMSSVATPYRQDVREIIPQDIQAAIRDHCGDYNVIRNGAFITVLPETCQLNFPAKQWAAAAQSLRAEPRLTKELRWHRASVATYVFVADIFRRRVQRALNRINFDERHR